MLNMNYLISINISTLKEMIKEEKDVEIRLKLLVVWHKKQGATERHIADILLIPRSTVGYLIRKFKKEGIKGFQRQKGSGGHNRYLTKEQEKELHENLKKNPMTTKEVLVYINENYKKQTGKNGKKDKDASLRC